MIVLLYNIAVNLISETSFETRLRARVRSLVYR